MMGPSGKAVDAVAALLQVLGAKHSPEGVPAWADHVLDRGLRRFRDVPVGVGCPAGLFSHNPVRPLVYAAPKWHHDCAQIQLQVGVSSNAEAQGRHLPVHLEALDVDPERRLVCRAETVVEWLPNVSEDARGLGLMPVVEEPEPCGGLLPFPSPQEGEEANAKVVLLAVTEAPLKVLAFQCGRRLQHGPPRSSRNLPRSQRPTLCERPRFVPTRPTDLTSNVMERASIEICAEHVHIVAESGHASYLGRSEASQCDSRRVIWIHCLHLLSHPVDPAPQAVGSSFLVDRGLQLIAN
mmetsp:Transcript_1666/g.4234  ORF Transcript_1666/g.4234 Transcript_1666/m.4234 type:complete len:295 (-) Transcript_1666:564-1448(-)